MSKSFFGIANHPVFMDGHFRGYNHLFTLEAELSDGTRRRLPILDYEGHVDNYLYSFAFVKWTFRVDGPKVNLDNLQNGIRDFSTFWAVKNNVPLGDVKFHVLVKEIDIPLKWEKDFLKKQEVKPWRNIGFGFWEDGIFKIELPEIETPK